MVYSERLISSTASQSLLRTLLERFVGGGGVLLLVRGEHDTLRLLEVHVVSVRLYYMVSFLAAVSFGPWFEKPFQTTGAFSRISLTLQRFCLERGRVSSMRTLSPTAHSLTSSWAL